MLKRIITILAALAVMCVLCAWTPSTIAGTNSKKTDDSLDLGTVGSIDTSSVLIKHRIFERENNDESKEYALVYYTGDDAHVKQVDDVLLIDKSRTDNINAYRDLDVNDVYPGFDNMSFAQAIFFENDTYLYIVLSFSNLDDSSNLKEFLKSEIIFQDSSTSKKTSLTADEAAKAFKNEGSTEIDTSDTPECLDKYFDVVEVNQGSSSSSSSSSSSTSDSKSSTSSTKVNNWDDAKSAAIGAYMTANQVNLDNPDLVYEDGGTDEHGYVVHCYANHDDHTETLFWYSVSSDGKVYDTLTNSYVN